MSYTSETLLKDSMVDTTKMANRADVKHQRYVDKNIDILTLNAHVLKWFRDRKFKTHIMVNGDKTLIQGEKKGWARTVTACNRSLNVLIEGTTSDFTVKVGSGKWTINTTSVVIGTFLTGGASVGLTGLACAWTFKLKVELHRFINDTIEFMA